MRRELLLGCGNKRDKVIRWAGTPEEFENLTTLDIDPNCGADVIHDLNCLPLPFESDSFDEIHAYQVLEHIGVQGDWKGFFALFEELHRVLKPDGCLAGACPMWDSPWAWSDPGHTRVITKHSLPFLRQAEYEAQVGKTNMTDYRSVYRGDFETLAVKEGEHEWGFILRAIK